ncbi:MAG: tRNA (adenosine(37)-N6)-dimethylallyltransferase MiaA [Gammaproteobacteria bacterium]
MSNPSAIFLMGPTASGKTDLAVELCAHLPCDIISVDSAMVYRGMDIGTAKPSQELRRRITHRLIDIRDPADTYSAAQFRLDALREMDEIRAHGRSPLLVGGTMLYFRALQRGLSVLPSADTALRARLDAQAQEIGWAALHERLAGIDPVAARRIHRNDPQRIQRALEVYELTSRTATELYAQNTAETWDKPVLKLIVVPSDRAVLHDRIARRFSAMLEQGFLEEVEGLRRRGDLDEETPALRAVGYRQAWGHLVGKTNCEEMAKSAIIATRQLAKRQFTWLRSEPDAVWFDSLDKDVFNTVTKFCANALSARQ